MSRRCVAWVFDAFLIAIMLFALWWVLVLFGFLTFGLGFGAMAILPFVPFCYHFLSLLGASAATPGQQMMGLTVRRDFDLGPPEGLQALVSVLVLYLTLATSGLLLVVSARFKAGAGTCRKLASAIFFPVNAESICR